jgi:hypothetical protein
MMDSFEILAKSPVCVKHQIVFQFVIKHEDMVLLPYPCPVAMVITIDHGHHGSLKEIL